MTDHPRSGETPPPFTTDTKENHMPAKLGNRSKRKISNRSKTKRAQATRKRVLSVKRKRRAKRSPR
ncbi:hypothetical protein Adeh_2838 [Anaeromyxobacter dehalogenans 2CP-C]|uniref:Uncharacterized protein n=2 Tax=Anaeromyxobacter dehalogenans TaxID=161493 RepID=Q2ILS6_ANADE|nr:hypothetical protein Adeh_2838 [Anaeromyxobacter dehalogenans 2CP-C]